MSKVDWSEWDVTGLKVANPDEAERYYNYDRVMRSGERSTPQARQNVLETMEIFRTDFGITPEFFQRVFKAQVANLEKLNSLSAQVHKGIFEEVKAYWQQLNNPDFILNPSLFIKEEAKIYTPLLTNCVVVRSLGELAVVILMDHIWPSVVLERINWIQDNPLKILSDFSAEHRLAYNPNGDIVYRYYFADTDDHEGLWHASVGLRLELNGQLFNTPEIIRDWYELIKDRL